MAHSLPVASNRFCYYFTFATLERVGARIYMTTMTRLIGHLIWLSSCNDRSPTERALAVYNAANRLKLASYTEPLDTDFAAEIRECTTQLAVLAIRQYVFECAFPRQRNPSLGDPVQTEIERMTFIADTHGIAVKDLEWAVASTPATLDEINDAIRDASKLSTFSAASASPYEQNVAQALALICDGLALAASQGKNAFYGKGIARIGLGFLESAGRDIEFKEIPTHLDEQVHIAGRFLINAIKVD